MAEYKTPETYLFHDYETFGLDPRRSMASQFASIRTDENLNPIDEDRLNIFCEITPDYLPSPDACLVTGQTPISIEEFKDKEFSSGIEYKDRTVLNEDKFALKIFRAMSKKGTCNIGYNNVNFDDEWSRNLFYRTLRNPYSREWRNGCSRSDAFKIVMFAYCLNPNIINFPNAIDKETGKEIILEDGSFAPSFKLEDLSKANGIEHENAHDAFNDVEATIKILQKIKQGDSDIFGHAMTLRIKNEMKKFISENQDKPLLHVSQYYGKDRRNATVLQFLSYDPSNPNNAIFVDLCEDVTLLEKHTPEELQSMLYMKNDELTEKRLKRPPFRIVAINKCEILAKLNMLPQGRAGEIGLNGDTIRNNKAYFEENKSFIEGLVGQVFTPSDMHESEDVDLNLYNGFFNNQEEEIMKEMHTANFRNELSDYTIDKSFSKLSKMFFRFKARNYPELLGVKETELWNRFKVERLTGKSWTGDESKPLLYAKETGEYTVDTYLHRINELKELHKNEPDKIRILDELILYVKKILPNYQF